MRCYRRGNVHLRRDISEEGTGAWALAKASRQGHRPRRGPVTGESKATVPWGYSREGGLDRKPGAGTESGVGGGMC